MPLGKKAPFPTQGSVSLRLVFCCFLEGVEELTGGSVAVPRIGWDCGNCLRLPSPGSAAVPCSQAVSHTSQLAQVSVCPTRALGKILE